MGNEERKTGRKPGGFRGPGPRGGGEKPKDLVGTWKKILGYCKQYMVVLIVAICCAAVGTVLTLAGPNKLSDITDCVTDGITPDTQKLEEILTATSENIAQGMATGSCEDITIDDTVITWNDQMEMMELLSEVTASDVDTGTATNTDTDEDAATGDMGIDSVDTATTGTDEVGANTTGTAGIETAGIDTADIDQEKALEIIDQLPESVYELIKPSIDMDKITHTALILVMLYALSYIMSATQGWIMATVTQIVTKKMRTDISEKINRLPMWFYNRTTTGDVLSRVTNDIDTIGQSLNQSIGNLISAIILFLGSFIMMLVTNVTMTVTAVVATIIGFGLMMLIMSRSQKYFSRQQKHLGQLNGHIEEIYAGHTVVKAYNGEENAQKTFNELNEKLCESGFRAQGLAGLMMPLMSFIGNLGYVAVCVVGGALALNDKISFGVIVAFMMYVRYFTQPLSQMAQAVQSLQSAAAAGERVFEFLEAEEMEDETGKRGIVEIIECSKNDKYSNADIYTVGGHVEFEHVRFGYEDSDEIVIHDFSAEAKPGQKVAIVGPTGAGKTTMVNLLMRFHEIQGGTIKINGVSTKDMTREAVHSQFCMVLQDTWLFEGTVRENLVYCTENVSDEKVKEACKAVGLDHFIRTLPHGYDTVLNDQVSLSQGQKQQMTIARAMIADKPMLILDEATSSVDTRTEQQIQNAMDKLMKNRTSFVIAHRLSTIKNADLILVMKDGDIIESGNHEQLLAQNGFYSELYNSQFDEVSA